MDQLQLTCWLELQTTQVSHAQLMSQVVPGDLEPFVVIDGSVIIIMANGR